MLEKLPFYGQVLIFAGAALGVVIAAYALWPNLGDMRTRISGLEEVYTDKQAEIRKGQAAEQRLPELEREIATKKQELFFIAFMSLSHSRFKRNKSSNFHVKTKAEKMANYTYKLAVYGIVAIIVFGAVMSYVGYQESVYPLDLMRGHLEGIGATSDPKTITNHINGINLQVDKIWDKLPETKNPVWIFPTDTTNFVRIKGDLDIMTVSVEKISAVPKDSSAFHTGMLDVKERAITLKDNIEDATPYMFVSISNIIFSTLWIAAIIGIFAVLKRKKEQLKEYDTTEGV